MRMNNDDQEITDVAYEIGLDAAKEMRKDKKLIPLVLGAICIIVVVFFFTMIFPLIDFSKVVGHAVGESSGHAAGIAVGSVEGVSEGVASGYEEGKEEGLSAKDTVAEIANTIENNINNLGRLEVLVANVDLTTYHEDGKKYGALYLIRGSAVFTIDLNDVTVTYKEGLVSIVLPQPEVEIKIDPAETELLAEWQNKFFNGTDSEGFEAYLNSFNAVKNVSEDQVADYAELKEIASASAIKQVEEIANAVCGNNNINVTVSVRPN